MTRDLKQRLAEHNGGKSPHTRKFKPWTLVANLGFADEPTAVAFEQYLKSGSGKTFLKRHFLRPAHASSPAPYDGLARQHV